MKPTNQASSPSEKDWLIINRIAYFIATISLTPKKFMFCFKHSRNLCDNLLLIMILYIRSLDINVWSKYVTEGMFYKLMVYVL